MGEICDAVTKSRRALMFINQRLAATGRAVLRRDEGRTEPAPNQIHRLISGLERGLSVVHPRTGAEVKLGESALAAVGAAAAASLNRYLRRFCRGIAWRAGAGILRGSSAAYGRSPRADRRQKHTRATRSRCPGPTGRGGITRSVAGDRSRLYPRRRWGVIIQRCETAENGARRRATTI